MPNATPKEARDCISGNHAFLIDQIGNRERLLWLGSGISRNIAPPLDELIEKAIHLLQEKISIDSSDEYQGVLNELLSFTNPNGVDASMPIASWDDTEKRQILGELVNNYSKILGIDVPEGKLGRNLLKVVDIYSNSGMKPDAEHFFLAMLTEEGACKFMVTTNWETMIEDAHDEIITGGSETIRTIASAVDNQDSGAWENTLFKIHGCAKKCVDLPGQYLPFLVDTESRIGAWISGPNRFEPIRTKIVDKLRTHYSLFVGLSAQDFNLKSIVQHHNGIGEPCHTPPRIMFTSEIKSDQRAVLEGTYGDDYYQTNRDEIVGQAGVSLWAKPLLGALYLMIMAKKLEIIIENGKFHCTLAKTLANEAVTGIQEKIDGNFDASKHDDSWCDLSRRLISHLSNFLNLYRKQTLDTEGIYKSLHTGTLRQLENDENISILEYETTLSTLGLLFAGEKEGMWEVNLSKLDVNLVSQFDIEMPGGVVRAFVLNNATRTNELEKNGYVDKPGLENVAIFYGTGSRFNMNGDEEGPVEFWLEEILETNVRKDALEKLESELKAAAVV